MAVSPSTAAYVAVVIVAATLFSIGTPANRSREALESAPAAPPPAVAAAAPAAEAAPAAAPPPVVAPANPPAAPAAAATPVKPISAPASAVSGGGITLTSVSFSMPDSVHAFPGGEAAQVMNANCTACHSPGMVLTQPKLSPAAWTEEVNKMRATYKAPVDAQDVPAIVDYLSKMKL